MTRRTNATVAGITFLVYIAAGIATLALAKRAFSSLWLRERMIPVALAWLGVIAFEAPARRHSV
jgi:apolipoprotein N-acyltransferase